MTHKVYIIRLCQGVRGTPDSPITANRFVASCALLGASSAQSIHSVLNPSKALSIKSLILVSIKLRISLSVYSCFRSLTSLTHHCALPRAILVIIQRSLIRNWVFVKWILGANCDLLWRTAIMYGGQNHLLHLFQSIHWLLA